MKKIILLGIACSVVHILSAQATTLAFVCPNPFKVMIRPPEPKHGIFYYEYLGNFGYSPQSSKAYDSPKFLGIATALIGNQDGYKSVLIDGATGTMSCRYKSRNMSTPQGEVINLVSPDNMLGIANGGPYTCKLKNQKILPHKTVSCTGTHIEDCQVICTDDNSR